MTPPCFACGDSTGRQAERPISVHGIELWVCRVCARKHLDEQAEIVSAIMAYERIENGADR